VAGAGTHRHAYDLHSRWNENEVMRRHVNRNYAKKLRLWWMVQQTGETLRCLVSCGTAFS
jgi:hypothetical protein